MAPYRAKKRLGQNFLVNDKIINSIIDQIDPEEDDVIIEIGSGRGALTLPLAENCHKLFAVEYDRDLIGYLEKLLAQYDNIELVHADFLEYQPNVKKYKLVGNLPYNISSPVIEWAVAHRDEIVEGCFMLQKEVALRLCASAGSKDWSPLSIFTRIFFEVELCFDISPKNFNPAPQVVSSLIKMKPKDQINIPNYNLFEKVVRASFKQRRKTLLNNLSSELFNSSEQAQSIIESAGFDPKIRAEQITIEQFLKLTELINLSKIN